MNDQNSSKTITVQITADDHFVESSLKNGLNFSLQYPIPPPPSKNPRATRPARNDKASDEALIFDANKLFLPSVMSFEAIKETPNFDLVKLSVNIDNSILSDTTIRNFSPIFLHLIRINNIPKVNESKFGKPYIKLISNGTEKQIFVTKDGDKLQLDSVLIMYPREQRDILFEYHDKPFTMRAGVPKGERLYIDIDQAILPHPTPNPCGYANFKLLPERKERVAIMPQIGAQFVVAPSNFHECETELVFEVFDTFAHLEDVQIPAKPKKPTKAHPETYDTEYYRVIIYGPITNFFFNSINLKLNEHHTIQLKLNKNKQLLQTYSYDKFATKCVDLITGVVFNTPDESYMFLEARYTPPNASMLLLQNLKSNKSVQVISSDVRFPFPRIYSNFDNLIKVCEIPVSVSELARNEKIYNRKSPLFLLFGLTQKLMALKSYDGFDEKTAQDIFPTESDVINMIAKADVLRPVVETTRIKIPRSLPASQSAYIRTVPKVSTYDSELILNGPAALRKKFEPVKPAKEEVKEEPPKIEPKRPKGLIHVTADKETEIWCVDDPSTLIEDGWDIEIIEIRPKTSRRDILERSKTTIQKKWRSPSKSDRPLEYELDKVPRSKTTMHVLKNK